MINMTAQILKLISYSCLGSIMQSMDFTPASQFGRLEHDQSLG